MAGMGWQTTGDVAAFRGEAGAFLRRERARNTVLLTLTEQLRVSHSRGAAADAGAADPAGLPLFGWRAGRGPAAAPSPRGLSSTRRRIRCCSPRSPRAPPLTSPPPWRAGRFAA